MTRGLMLVVYVMFCMKKHSTVCLHSVGATKDGPAKKCSGHPAKMLNQTQLLLQCNAMRVSCLGERGCGLLQNLPSPPSKDGGRGWPVGISHRSVVPAPLKATSSNCSPVTTVLNACMSGSVACSAAIRA